jgi:hypothetical protein
MHLSHVQIAQPEVGGVSSGGAGLTFMPNKRGNPNWGRPMLPSSVVFTEFEMQARRLHLTPDQYFRVALFQHPRLLATVDIGFVRQGFLPIPHIQPLSRSSII